MEKGEYKKSVKTENPFKLITLTLDIQETSLLEDILGKEVEQDEENPKSGTRLMTAYSILKRLQENV